MNQKMTHIEVVERAKTLPLSLFTNTNRWLIQAMSKSLISSARVDCLWISSLAWPFSHLGISCLPVP